MAITRERAQAWLDSYVSAWKSYDERSIRDLFSDNVTYSAHPYEATTNGRDSVVTYWLNHRDEPETYSGDYKITLIDGDHAVAEGRSYYFPANEPSQVKNEFANVFFLTFDPEGKVSEYREYYVPRPKS